MDRLDEMQIFVAIVDEGSLAGAARRRRRSSAAVTRALAALEERLGARLIDRTTRRLTVTPAGRDFARKARAILADYVAATNDAADDRIRGLVRITAPIPFGCKHVTPIVASFLDAYPKVQVELFFHNRNVDMVELGLDVAVRIGDLMDSTLRVRRVGVVRQIVVASPAYLEARGTPETPDQLADHAIIFGTAPGAVSEWRFGTARERVVKLAPRLLANEVEAQLSIAKSAGGIARVLSYQAADGLADGSLRRLLQPYEPPAVPVQLVTTAGSRPARVDAFLELATRALRSLPAIRED